MSIFVNKPVIVREVFADNLEYEFMLIRSVLHNYSFVSMDTEFPGTIFKPDKKFVQLGNPEVNYRFMKVNVDAIKIIQLGLTLSDSEGNLPDFGTPFFFDIKYNFNHQAGSDSLLILRCFMQIKDTKAFKQCNQKLSALALYGLV
ncbi:hypothetical protein GOBAR_AA22220 [Gossypium barbadense]|uniref:poly(A)-specific ribonuclease n=1 Tax=Gossypium barbadense TaxID=3634 RepID=A0A2P5X529_GOSBA|nr:hypothetical protein GOBAR_AA22220 [Gossypium barbadense]